MDEVFTWEDAIYDVLDYAHDYDVDLNQKYHNAPKKFDAETMLKSMFLENKNVGVYNWDFCEKYYVSISRLGDSEFTLSIYQDDDYEVFCVRKILGYYDNVCELIDFPFRLIDEWQKEFKNELG